MFLKNKNIIFKIRRSKVTDYAALNILVFVKCIAAGRSQNSCKAMIYNKTNPSLRELEVNFWFESSSTYEYHGRIPDPLGKSCD